MPAPENGPHVPGRWWACGLGVALGITYTASPLLVVCVVASLWLGYISCRQLPASERTLVGSLLAVSLAVRVALIGLLLAAALPQLNDLATGFLAGDEGYNLAHSLRSRDIALGFGNTRYDYFVAFDEYGRSSYLSVLKWLQLATGPSPFGLRLVNMVFFTAGAIILHAMVRQAYGATTAAITLAATLFLPTLVQSSISLLKESLFFLASTSFLGCVWLFLHSSSVRVRVLSLVAAAGTLWILDDLRRGAVVLALSGLAIAAVLRFTFTSGRRVAAALVLAGAIAVTVPMVPSVSHRLTGLVEQVAVIHAGNVFTVGRPYKLLDAGFYMNPRPTAAPIRLTGQQALNFVIRGVLSFVLVPLPWETSALPDLAYLPQHVLWYVVIAFVPLGIVAGWRANPLFTSLLVGQIIPTAGVLALTNGNIGTLVRLRGLVWPLLICLATLGLLRMLSEAARPRAAVPERTPRADG